MNLNFTHKPDYYFFAERFIGFLQTKLSRIPRETHLRFPLDVVYQAFDQDFASTTTNLDAIMNIVEQYTVNGQRLMNSYIIDAKYNTLDIELDANALDHFEQEHLLTPPDPSSYE